MHATLDILPVIHPQFFQDDCPEFGNVFPVRSFSSKALVFEARLPISNALPSSPIRGPCPPTLATFPCRSRPVAADPVPATKTIAAPISPVASRVSSRSVNSHPPAPENSSDNSFFIFR